MDVSRLSRNQGAFARDERSSGHISAYVGGSTAPRHRASSGSTGEPGATQPAPPATQVAVVPRPPWSGRPEYDGNITKLVRGPQPYGWRPEVLLAVVAAFLDPISVAFRSFNDARVGAVSPNQGPFDDLCSGSCIGSRRRVADVE